MPIALQNQLDDDCARPAERVVERAGERGTEKPVAMPVERLVKRAAEGLGAKPQEMAGERPRGMSWRPRERAVGRPKLELSVGLHVAWPFAHAASAAS
jgi:hypothetical protein